MKKALTLVEILIVVAILGILAAVALPTFQSHTRQAKEAAAKDNLRLLRNAIELYAAQHNNVPPGYPNGDTTETPNHITFASQLTKSTNINGQIADTGTSGYPFGPYISAIPLNPFNNFIAAKVLGDDEEFPTDAIVDSGWFGWIYKPSTKKIKLNWSGTDTEGAPYFDY
jgi:prepilin-type N-terminal cleavage/methylation domain-containing protein